MRRAWSMPARPTRTTRRTWCGARCATARACAARNRWCSPPKRSPCSKAALTCPSRICSAPRRRSCATEFCSASRAKPTAFRPTRSCANSWRAFRLAPRQSSAQCKGCSSVRKFAALACLIAALLSLLLGARSAKADSALKLEAVPALGANSPALDGWGEIYVRLENSGSTQVNGFVELRAGLGGRPARTLSRAPFSIAPKGRVNLLLPSHNLLRVSEAKVVAVDAQGEALSEGPLPPLRALDPLLFDLHTPSRLAPVLNTQPVPTVRRRSGSYGYG